MINRLMGIAALLAAMIALPFFASAADTTTAGTLSIEHPWSRPTDAMASTGAIYLVVKNSGSTGDKLVAASTEIAGTTELHTNIEKGGMMHMEHVEGIDVPAHGAASLKPGGYHIMLMDMKSQLKTGSSFPLKLTFEKAGTVTVQVHVEQSGPKGKSPKSEKMEGMGESMKGMKG